MRDRDKLAARLAAVEELLRDLRDERAEAQRRHDAASAKLPDGRIDPKSAAAQRVMSIAREMREIDDKIAAATDEQVAILKMLGRDGGHGAPGDAGAIDLTVPGGWLAAAIETSKEHA